jgi:hypothetical protein
VALAWRRLRAGRAFAYSSSDDSRIVAQAPLNFTSRGTTTVAVIIPVKPKEFSVDPGIAANVQPSLSQRSRPYLPCSLACRGRARESLCGRPVLFGFQAQKASLFLDCSEFEFSATGT